ncbi:MAG: hypothetical protein ACK5LS_01755, partial [Propioniciclava sp.]
ALLDPRRIAEIVGYTLEHFDQKTRRESRYTHSVVTNVPQASRTTRPAKAIRQRRRVRGLNAIVATASIDAARAYYNQFQRAVEEPTSGSATQDWAHLLLRRQRGHR